MQAELCASKHAAKCLRMGGKWLSHNDMAEITEFLKLRQEHSETMNEAGGVGSPPDVLIYNIDSDPRSYRLRLSRYDDNNK